MWLLLAIFHYCLATVQPETVGNFLSSCKGDTDWRRGKRELGKEIALWLETVEIIASDSAAGNGSFAIKEADDAHENAKIIMIMENGVVWRRHDENCLNLNH